MKFNPEFQTFSAIKATVAISFAVYGAVVTGRRARRSPSRLVRDCDCCSFVAWGFARARVSGTKKPAAREV
jgi:hypothetical protein